MIAGKAAEGLGRRDEAISRFERAVSADPRNADAHASLGRIFALEGRNEDALERYDRAVEIDPGYASAHIGRGSALARLGRPGDALEIYRLAAKADPSNIEPHMAADALDKALDNQPMLEPGDKDAVGHGGVMVQGDDRQAGAMGDAGDMIRRIRRSKRRVGDDRGE